MTDPEEIEAALTSGVTEIDGRVYPITLPRTPVLPAITYHLVSQPTDVSQEGVQYRSPRWRLRIWSADYADLIPIAKEIAAIFGDQQQTPFQSSRIEYPASATEEQDPDTHFFSRMVDVVVGLAPAGTTGQ